MKSYGFPNDRRAEGSSRDESHSLTRFPNLHCQESNDSVRNREYLQELAEYTQFPNTAVIAFPLHAGADIDGIITFNTSFECPSEYDPGRGSGRNGSPSVTIFGPS